ncbi:hypothetical protein GQ53DRAFT_845317 [Thozetella sp. PMI_491]|nr:hypothetical protein GQ53DRAFT_845317 [Thozetella sp. PMI_491]
MTSVRRSWLAFFRRRKRGDSPDNGKPSPAGDTAPSRSAPASKVELRQNNLRTELIPADRPQQLSEEDRVSLDLWNTAYDNLKAGKDTSKLVEAYESILIGSTIGTKNSELNLDCGEAERLAHMRDIAHHALVETKRTEKTESTVHQAAILARSAFQVVGNVLEAYPPAALACSGICLLLSLLANRSAQNMAMIEGLVYVTENLEWYLSISGITFANSAGPATQQQIVHLQVSLRAKLTKLIEGLLEFEMKSVCRCYEDDQLLRVLRPMLAIDDWKNRLDRLKDLESDINKHVSQFQGTYGVTILRQMDGLRTQMDSIASSMQKTGDRHTNIAGRVSMIRGRWGKSGNWELVASIPGGGFFHAAREMDRSDRAWRQPVEFGAELDGVTGLSMIQSNIGNPGNLELACVVDGVVAVFWRNCSNFGWSDPNMIWTHPRCTGSPALIQGNFYKQGNFELVVPCAERGLVHYYRENDDPDYPWRRGGWFGRSLKGVTSVSLIQSNYGSPHGNFEVVCVAEGRLYSFYRDHGSEPHRWAGPHAIHPHIKVIGNPVLIQSQAGKKGNFELVVPSERGGLLHFWRNNDEPEQTWSMPTHFAQDLGQISDVAFIESDGRLEVCCYKDGEVYHTSRSSEGEWSSPSSVLCPP